MDPESGCCPMADIEKKSNNAGRMGFMQWFEIRCREAKELHKDVKIFPFRFEYTPPGNAP
jgi:hypothetical protein